MEIGAADGTPDGLLVGVAVGIFDDIAVGIADGVDEGVAESTALGVGDGVSTGSANGICANTINRSLVTTRNLCTWVGAGGSVFLTGEAGTETEESEGCSFVPLSSSSPSLMLASFTPDSPSALTSGTTSSFTALIGSASFSLNSLYFIPGNNTAPGKDSRLIDMESPFFSPANTCIASA